MLELTVNELKSLINVVGQVNVPVNQSPAFVALINKMSAMIDEQAKKKNTELKGLESVKVKKDK